MTKVKSRWTLWGEPWWTWASIAALWLLLLGSAFQWWSFWWFVVPYLALLVFGYGGVLVLRWMRRERRESDTARRRTGVTSSPGGHGFRSTRDKTRRIV